MRINNRCISSPTTFPSPVRSTKPGHPPSEWRKFPQKTQQPPQDWIYSIWIGDLPKEIDILISYIISFTPPAPFFRRKNSRTESPQTNLITQWQQCATTYRLRSYKDLLESHIPKDSRSVLQVRFTGESPSTHSSFPDRHPCLQYCFLVPHRIPSSHQTVPEE